MEIKTCEEYVVTKLVENENEVAHLKEVIHDLSARVNSYENVFNYIKQFIKVSVTSTGIPTIGIDSLWETHDTEAFNNFKSIFDLGYRVDALKPVDESSSQDSAEEETDADESTEE